MEEKTKRPNAALINREWFDAARSVLSIQDLGIVLVKACEYVYGQDTFDIGGDLQKAVFAMIKPALDSDIARYLDRCARNAANAKSQRQRVAASGSEWQPVAANTNTTTTTNPTTTPTTTPSLSPEEIEEREKWLVFGYFWSTGTKTIKEELLAFWSYYESLGWKNNKGAPIVSKLAAARMWRRQFEIGQAPNGADAWFRVMQDCPVYDYNVWRCFAGAERTESGAVVRLHCKRAFYESIVNVYPAIEKRLAGLWRASGVVFECLWDEQG